MTSVWSGHEPFATEEEARWPAHEVGISGSPYEAPAFQAFEEAAGPSTPPSVQEILELRHARESLEWGAVRRAVAAGNKDPGRLTNLVFLARHPERGVRALSTSEPGYAALAAEREAIRDTIVRPVLAQNPAPAPSAETWVPWADQVLPAESTWLETSTTGAEEVPGQDGAGPALEHWAIAPAVRSQDGARVPATSVEAWAALARALWASRHEAGPSLGEAASGIEDWTAAELPFISEGPGAPSYVENALIQAEIRKGITNENVLTDFVFYRRYPARNRRPLSPIEPNFSTLSQEWLAIRDTQVRPLLTAPSSPVGRPYVPAPPAGPPGSPSGGVSGTAPQLAQQILNHPDIALTGRCVRDDITRTTQGQPGTAGTSLSAKMLSDLLDLARSQKVIVTAIESGGTGHADDSNHYRGTAFDVVPDPPSVTGLQSIAKTAYDRRGAWAIHELIFSPMASGTTTLYNGLPHTYKAETMNAHKDHVHLSVK